MTVKKCFEGTELEMRKAATKIHEMEFQYYLMMSQFKRHSIKNMRSRIILIKYALEVNKSVHMA